MKRETENERRVLCEPCGKQTQLKTIFDKTQRHFVNASLGQRKLCGHWFEIRD